MSNLSNSINRKCSNVVANKHEDSFNNIMTSLNGSVPAFLDSIFGFLAKYKPLSVLNTDGIALEHHISRALNKWRQHLLLQQQQQQDLMQQSLASTNAANTQCLDKQSSDGECSQTSNLGEGLTDCSIVAEEVTITSEEVETSSTASKPPRYRWSQTMEDVDITVPVPSAIVKANQLSVRIESGSVGVSIRDDTQPLLEGSLHQPVNVAESLWNLVPRQYVTLQLSKREEVWWNCLPSAAVFGGGEGEMEGGGEAERPISSLNSDEQADMQRIVFDAKQKALGKPTTEQMKMEGMLRQAWDVEGSPFKGQPFDPSIVNVAPHSQ